MVCCLLVKYDWVFKSCSEIHNCVFLCVCVCVSGQSTNHRTQTDIISSFEPLVAELDRLPSRLPQVFVSFCKEELGDNFIRHLAWALRELGINVLMDSYNRRGKEDEQQQVFTNIEKSNIVLAIFSKRYSESDRCLNELVKMEELTKEGKLVVIPVFYNVKTNEVRRLQGEFGIHFADSLKRFSMEPMMVQSWEEALNFITKRSIGLSLERHRYYENKNNQFLCFIAGLCV